MRTSKEQEFNELLDKKLLPLVSTALNLFDESVTKEMREGTLYELFSLALLEGIKLSEKTEEALNKEQEDKIEKFLNGDEALSRLEHGMKQHKKTREYAAKLSLGKDGMLGDGTPRFVTPDQINPITGEYKKGK